jgi:hypothetical protein
MYMVQQEKRQQPPDPLHLKHFLLQEELHEMNQRPLFDSNSDLGRAVWECEVASLPEDAPSPPIRSMISMVEQGLAGKRPFKPERAIALREAVRKRLQQRAPERVDELMKRFDFTYHLLCATRKNPYETNLGKTLPETYGTGTTLVIIPYVKDAVETSGGRQLLQSFIASYGLTGNEVPVDKRSQHLLAFSGEEDLLAFLMSVISEAIYTEVGTRDYPIREEQIKKIFARLEREERRGGLSFALIPAHFCLTSVVIYDCEYEEGVTLMLSYGEGVFQYMQMRGIFRQGYRQLFMDLVKGQGEEFRFVSPAIFHDSIMYQLLSFSAGV